MKNNRELLVTYCDNLRLPDGSYSMPKRGSVLTKLSLYDLLFKSHRLEDIPTNAVKGSCGSMWAYVQDTLGIEHNEEKQSWSDGIIFIDIDNMLKEDIKTIYESFDKLTKIMPDILACWYSNSYNNSKIDTGGLHFVLRASDEPIFADDYKKHVENSGATLCRVIYKVTDIDCRPRHTTVKKWDNNELVSTNSICGIDKVTKSVGQRFYLNHSTVQWNDNAFSVCYTCDDKLIEWFEEYEKWFTVESDFEIVSCKVKSIKSPEKIIVPEKLGHSNRITVMNTLTYLGYSHTERVSILLSICGPGDYAGGEYVLKKYIESSSRTSEHVKLEPKHIKRGLEILKKAGYEIDAEIKQIYTPIKFDFDSIFMDAYEEVCKSWVPPVQKNRLEINLKTGEYLADYKEEITDMIMKYQMTYLIADCQVGKTTYALNMQNNYGLFTDYDFIVHFSGDSIDVCVPYNSVADNKAKGSRKDIKRVKTADIKKFDMDKRNVFIWNTIVPLYEDYFKNGIVRRLVLFFDESQKIVTDDYRWSTLFEMFKVLPSMYTHFVFMTGTPAGELEYLKEFFDDYCIINAVKEKEHDMKCEILKYKHFGNGDRITLIEDTISRGKLPLIYANTKFNAWREACWEINKERKLQGLKPYNILDYSRPNSEELIGVNKSNSIKDYDIVLATKYCSVGIDFIKDDKRLRCAIVDYASEHECTFHDIWQFTLRNRNQNVLTKIIARDDETYDAKLSNYWYYVNHFDLLAKVHTHEIGRLKNLDEEERKDMDFASMVFQDRKFYKYDSYFESDSRNIKLLGLYYRYARIFSNMNTIKSMLKKRGVEVTETAMPHFEKRINNEIKKEIYSFFIDNYAEISQIYNCKTQFDSKSYQIDINSDSKEYILENKIHSRNMHYMDWLIYQFAGKDEWYEVLKEYECLTKDTFATYNYLKNIARYITTKDIAKIKRLYKSWSEEDLDDLIESIAFRDFKDAIPNGVSEREKSILLNDVISHYKKILPFAIENIKYIEEIKSASDNATRITALHKMKIIIDQKEDERVRKAKSVAVTKRNEKPITVRYLANGKTKTFKSQKEMAEFFKVDERTIGRLAKAQNCKLSQVVQVVEC